MRGPALALEATDLRPGLKVIFASGYGESKETQAVAGAIRLGKPYDHQQLAQALGEATG